MMVVATLGSAGDLHPFLAVARTLQEQGEEVLLLSQQAHQDEVQAQGLAFGAIATLRDHQRTLDHPALWHPVRGFGVLWRHLAVPSVAPCVNILETLWQRHPGQLTVFASPLVLGARLLREQRPFRLVTGYTAPANLRSHQHPMFVAGHAIPRWWPDGARAALWTALDRYKLDPMAQPLVRQWLHARGLGAPGPALFKSWIHSPDGHLALFPSDFGPLPTDWPVKPCFAGFPLYLPQTAGALNPSLQAFLQAPGPAPVVIYRGPNAALRRDDFHQLTQALLRQGQRCITLAAPTGQTADITAPSDRHAVAPTPQPLPELLRHAKAFVHHGGIGVIAQGLAAGVPQCCLPSAFDQQDNAWRLAQMQGGPVSGSPQALVRHIVGLPNHVNPPRPASKSCSLPGRPNGASLAAAHYLRDATA